MKKLNLNKPATQKHTNIKLYPENIDGKSYFNIYIDFSGKRELLTTHRHNGPLYKLLENGIKLDDLIRYQFKKRSGHQTRYSTSETLALTHLLKTVDEYMVYSM